MFTRIYTILFGIWNFCVALPTRYHHARRHLVVDTRLIMTNYKIFVQHYFRYLTFSPVNFEFFCYRITFPSLTNAHERAPGTRRRIFKVAHDGAPHIPQPRRTRADMFVGNERANSRMCLSLSLSLSSPPGTLKPSSSILLRFCCVCARAWCSFASNSRTRRNCPRRSTTDNIS